MATSTKLSNTRAAFLGILIAVVSLGCCISSAIRSANRKAPALARTTPLPAATIAQGLTRGNPVPLGEVVLADNGIALAASRVLRGAEAWQEIEAMSVINGEPSAGMEYILVTVEARFTGGPDDTQRVSRSYFRCVGDRGQIYAGASVIVEPDLSLELFGGASAQGRIAFEVPRDEHGLALIYSGAGTKARFLALAP